MKLGEFDMQPALELVPIGERASKERLNEVDWMDQFGEQAEVALVRRKAHCSQIRHYMVREKF